MPAKSFNINFFSGNKHCQPILKNILASEGKTLRQVASEQITFLKQKEDSNELKKPNWSNKNYSQIFTQTLENSNLESEILDLEIKLNLVVSQPSRLNGKKIVINQIAEFAQKNNLKLFTPEKINKEVEEFADLNQNPSISIVCAFGQLLSDKVLQTPQFGFINWHPSLLPLYRGATPIQSTLLDRQMFTGLSWINLIKAMDAGEILLQLPTQIKPEQTFVDLIEQFAALGSQTWALAVVNKLLLVDLQVKNLANNENLQNWGILIQDDSQATFCTKIEKEDGIFEPQTLDNHAIYAKYKAFYEYPQISFVDDFFGGKVKIKSCNLPDQQIDFSKSENILFESTNWLQIKLNKQLFTFLKTKNSLLQIQKIALENGKIVDFSGFLFERK